MPMRREPVAPRASSGAHPSGSYSVFQELLTLSLSEKMRRRFDDWTGSQARDAPLKSEVTEFKRSLGASAA